MAETAEPLTTEEEAALRELASKHRLVALVLAVLTSAYVALILHTIWHDWLLDARDLGPLAFFVVNVVGGLGWWEWGLRGLRESEAMDRQWKLRNVRW
jgi:hypothetical protein